jgi:hypothetical protein
MSLREILLTGSVPMHPASAVYEVVSRCVGDAMRRMPDGEQSGWVVGVRKAMAQKRDCFQPGNVTRIGTVVEFAEPVQMLRLKPGLAPGDVHLNELGFAINALASYTEFRRLKAEGRIRADMRFQATVAGPATTGGMLEMPEADVMAIIEPALAAEIRRIVDAIPPSELTVQLDLAVEVEKEEFRRRPGAFDTPVFALRDFTFEGTTDAVARLANAIPPDVELGFHLCAMWHVFKGAGQDLRVHVDYANALMRKVKRPIAYFHLPTTPEYEEKDFHPLRDLQLRPGTKLFLGLIHAVDGFEGASRRVKAAQAVVADFGVGHFCGLSQWRTGPETVEPMLELHRLAASV